MVVLLVILGMSALFVLAVYFVDRSWGSGGVCALAAIATPVSCLLLVPVLLLHCFGTFLLSGLCAAFRAPAGWGTASSVVAALAAYLLGAWMVYGEWSRLHQLAQQYPLVSLDERLAYETRERATSPPQLAASVEARLGTFEERRGFGISGLRRELLRRLHDDSHADFVIARGFGNARMMGIAQSRLHLPEVAPVPLPHRNESFPLDGTDASETAPPARELPPRRRADYSDWHSQSAQDFLDPERMGYARSRSQVAGFAPHQFRKVPEVGKEEEWKVVRLELISLLRHAKPVAYVSEHLPNMSELEGAPTRPLNPFEESALKKLRAEEDVVIDEAPDRIRMVGSLRAASDCRACHSVERGELLGALSYVLLRTRPAPKTKPMPKESA